MRAIAQWDGEVPDAPLSELVGDGRLAVTIDPLKGRELYQAIVELEGLSVAEAFENYFARSEQLATRLWLASDTRQAAGMLLQRLPDSPLSDDEAWIRAVHLGSTITREELLALPVAEIIHRLYHEEDIRLFSRMPVSFRCSCSRRRVETVLRMLGRDEVHSILAEQGSIHVDCEFCGDSYEFDRIDAEQLFAGVHGTPATTTRH
jgi:molecular chaperone Hsp33